MVILHLCLLAGHVQSQVNHAVGVAPLVIVPGHDLQARQVTKVKACDQKKKKTHAIVLASAEVHS